MSYHYPGKIHLFPYYEAPLVVFGAGGIIAWKEYGLPPLWGNVALGVGVALLCVASILWMARTIWNDQPISDYAFHMLQKEARFPSVSNAWEVVCGECRRPTWKELEIIVSHIYWELH